MSQRTIAFVGISGVGKSTFLRSAAKKIPFQHLTAGSLIGRARESECDRLRLQNIDENQRLLVAGFEMAKNSTGSLVVIDGHVIIDAGNGLQAIGADVFAALSVGAIVHLEAKAMQILTYRQGDKSRDRPTLSVNELAAHQIRSRNAALDISRSLTIPFRSFSHDDVSEFCAFAIGL
jgi:adenylate kinase